jgi:hypothetical protein
VHNVGYLKHRYLHQLKELYGFSDCDQRSFVGSNIRTRRCGKRSQSHGRPSGTDLPFRLSLKK